MNYDACHFFIFLFNKSLNCLIRIAFGKLIADARLYIVAVKQTLMGNSLLAIMPDNALQMLHFREALYSQNYMLHNAVKPWTKLISNIFSV